MTLEEYISLHTSPENEVLEAIHVERARAGARVKYAESHDSAEADFGVRYVHGL